LVLLSILLLPLATGCSNAFALIPAVWGSILATDFVLTPVRAAVGGAILNFVNTFTI
jgi:hypothetical protein